MEPNLKSHEYQVDRRTLLRHGGSLLGGLATIILALHGASFLGVFPQPRPTPDVDAAILVHQADSSRKASGAKLLLVGDSSCLMDVDAAQLGEHLKTKCLNLGTLSFLDLSAASRLVNNYSEANPGKPKWVVLLIHPEALRQAMSDPDAHAFLETYLRGELLPTMQTLSGRLQSISGLSSLKARVLDRWISTPLSGDFGHRYGFTSQMERYMDTHDGSLVDPRTMALKGNSEYQMAARWEGTSRAFRGRLPEGIQILVGITPIPESFAPTNHTARQREMLGTWAGWLEAEGILTNLPAIMSDGLFASITHLNEEGIEAYTRQLAEALERVREE